MHRIFALSYPALQQITSSQIHPRTHRRNYFRMGILHCYTPFFLFHQRQLHICRLHKCSCRHMDIWDCHKPFLGDEEKVRTSR